MSINPLTLRDLENIYADYEMFRDDGDYTKASESLDIMAEFYGIEVKRLRMELKESRKTL